jgi:hypothetical protein
VGPRAGLDKCGKSRPPPGFDTRTVQSVASRYTDYAIRPTLTDISLFFIFGNIRAHVLLYLLHAVKLRTLNIFAHFFTRFHNSYNKQQNISVQNLNPLLFLMAKKLYT